MEPDQEKKLDNRGRSRSGSGFGPLLLETVEVPGQARCISTVINRSSRLTGLRR